MIRKYIKKPEIIEAIRYDGTNLEEINEFTKDDSTIASIEKQSDKYLDISREYLYLQSTRGNVRIYIGDYITKDILGETKVFTGDHFEALYEYFTDISSNKLER